MPDSADTCQLVPLNPEFRKAGEWLRMFRDNTDEISRRMNQIYGDDSGFIKTRRTVFLKALESFVGIYGDSREVAITRSPCRINLRGMHSEMQHATPNYLTHGREIVVVAGKRNDDRVALDNVNSENFGSREFTISDEIERGKWGNWIDFIDSLGVRKAVESAKGDWVNYVKASVLKLQDSFSDTKLRGMDAVVCGDIPMGSGMASSSALFVSSGLAVMAVNGLSMDCRELVVSMGRGEWYVGTRGGFGDHGAMLFGRRGHILHSVFLTVDEIQPEYIPFPQDHQVVIINSYKTSSKSAECLFSYNQTIFAYNIAMSLIKDVLKNIGGYDSDFLAQLNYLGQITPEIFGLQRIYEILRALPERITIAKLMESNSSLQIESSLDRFFGQLKKYPESVDVRGAALWGIAESERSREFARLMKEGKIRKAGELMFIGHDGDRLFAFNKSTEFKGNIVTDEYLDSLLDDLQSGNPERIQRTQLARQPGDFNASSPELDRIVDIARQTEGVIGASLTGAGFGGNVLVIAKKSDEVLNSLKDALFKGYYETQEKKELEWFIKDQKLRSAFANDDELKQIKGRLKEIVTIKQKTKAGMNESDIRYTTSIQRKINALFKEGKIDREMLFIPADYYKDGVIVNVTVDKAGAL